jgi:Fe-S oxidoreductase
VTRGRANSLRLAMTGQLGPDALTSDAMAETLKLCVSCKACRRECPTGVDMARMKVEVSRARAEKFGLSLHDRLVGYLPRYAPYAARLHWLVNLRDIVPGAAKLSEVTAGFSARRSLPKWRADYFKEPNPSWPGLSRPSTSPAPKVVDARDIGEQSDAVLRTAMRGHDGNTGGEVVLFADTFNRYFERETIDAALAVMTAGGYRVHFATPAGERPLCCGRTFLSVGKVDEARREAERTVAALAPFVSKGIPVLGLEPSCLFGFRDEIPALLKSEAARRLADNALLFEEFLAREAAAGKLALPLQATKKRALLHGHCHQKSFDTMGAVETALKLIPDLKVEKIESSCCGMAGAFGYHADTIDVSRAMGELSLLPAVRQAPEDAIIVADGTSCRHQIHDGTGREAIHVARALAMALP